MDKSLPYFKPSLGYDSMYSGIKQQETYIVRKSTLRLENSQVWCQ